MSAIDADWKDQLELVRASHSTLLLPRHMIVSASVQDSLTIEHRYREEELVARFPYCEEARQTTRRLVDSL